MSVDGYVTGPDPGPEHPLGVGGERLHDWALSTRSWREEHGREGGETGVDDDQVAEALENQGATIMGKRMFGGWEGPWEDGYIGVWGEDPPFKVPVFVLTHHPRDPIEVGTTTYTFVSDGIESALEQARAAAGGADVNLAGGANVAQQYLAAGLVDEIRLHVAPLVLGGGTPLFANLEDIELEPVRTVHSPRATHITYRRR